jgi:hypothetical protein
MTHPPLPTGCPFFGEQFEFRGGPCIPFAIPDSDHDISYLSEHPGTEEEEQAFEKAKPLIAAVAFFYWTREAQRLKRLCEQQPHPLTWQAHVEAVQAAVGWAKWSGL